jgi:hypothetical protein
MEAVVRRRCRAAWWRTSKEVCGVLSSQEEHVWDDIQRNWAVEAEEPPRLVPSRAMRASDDESDVPVAVAIGARITIVLLLFGAFPAAMAVALATALGWVLGRKQPPPTRNPEAVDDTTAAVRARPTKAAPGGVYGV